MSQPGPPPPIRCSRCGGNKRYIVPLRDEPRRLCPCPRRPYRDHAQQVERQIREMLGCHIPDPDCHTCPSSARCAELVQGFATRAARQKPSPAAAHASFPAVPPRFAGRPA